MSDTTKADEARDAILNAITGFLQRNATPSPSSIRTLAEAHALASGEVHTVRHTEANVKG